MPKAFSEHEKETIRARIRQKGKKLFERQGLKKTSVDELAQAGGISKGALKKAKAFSGCCLGIFGVGFNDEE